MIRHIVWWTLKPEANGKDAAANAKIISESWKELRSIASCRSVDVSVKIKAGTTVPCQVVLVSTHDGEKELDAYKKDPVHVKFAEQITAVAASRNCIDYEIE